MTLIAFDFDGTLSDSEMLVLLAEQCGAADRVAAITERAMNDEISYAESLRERAALLEGLPEEAAEAAFDSVTLRPGAADLVRELDAAGVHTAILTGGFERGVERALVNGAVPASDPHRRSSERSPDAPSVDAVVANALPVADGELTGAVEGPLIEGTKDDALEAVASDAGIALEDAIAVGDGANDLPMLEVAGLAVGFDPKDAVRPHCDVVVETMAELREVLGDEGVV